MEVELQSVEFPVIELLNVEFHVIQLLHVYFHAIELSLAKREIPVKFLIWRNLRAGLLNGKLYVNRYLNTKFRVIELLIL